MPAPTPTCTCGSCKKCRNRAVHRARRERDPERGQQQQRRWRQANPAKVKEIQTAYRRSEAGRAAEARRQRRDRVKVRARSAVQQALRNGQLVRGPCALAGRGPCSGRIEGHHHDYRKPLDVTWVCAQHHAELDREEAAA